MATQIQELKYNCAMSHTLICRAYRLACTGPQTGLAMSSTVYSWHSLQSSFFCSCSAFSYSLNLCFRAFSWHCLGHVRGPIWDLLVAESRLGQLGHNIYAVCVPGLPFGFSFLLFELWLWLCLCLTVLLVWKNDAVAQIRCLLKVEFRASPIVVGLIKLARR